MLFSQLSKYSIFVNYAMNKMNKIAIILEDHLLFAVSFSALIERLKIFDSIYTTDSNKELKQLIDNHEDNVIYLFLDYYLKDSIGLTLIPEIKKLKRKIKLIVMSSITSYSAANYILDYKPDGFVSKSSGFDTILHCLTQISEGNKYICPVITKIVEEFPTNENSHFTPRELEILQYFAQGFSIAQTAEKVFLSKHTIVAHRRNMMTKAQVNSITELLAHARKQELI